MTTVTDVQVSNVYRIIGTIKEDGTPVDISTASVKKIRIKPPSGDAAEVAVDFLTDGTDGKLVYEHTASEEGVYRFQFYIELSNFQGYTKTASVRCRPNL